MASLYDTFFFNPVDTFGITAGYTVPQGFFARIYPNSSYAIVDGNEIFLTASSTFTLNARYHGIGNDFSGKIFSNSGNGTKGIYRSCARHDGTGVEQYYTTTLVSALTTNPVNAYLYKGTAIRINTGERGTDLDGRLGTGYILIGTASAANVSWTMSSFSPHHVFVKSGTILNGDFTVELFKNPLGV